MMAQPFHMLMRGEGCEMKIVPVALGDLYVSEGRNRMIWTLASIVTVPKIGTMVRLAQVDGEGRVTLSVSNLSGGYGFQRVDEAVLPRT